MMSETLRRSFVYLAWTAAAMSALLAFLPAAGHDQLWFLLLAGRWLHGAALYGPTAFDSNPPMVVWLSALPVLLAEPLHLAASTAAKGLVLLASLGVAAFAYRLLSRVWRPVQGAERAALLFAFVVIAFVLPARDLGQRDALAGLLALPYVLAATPAPSVRVPSFQRLAAVLLAALAFCLKPQDALIAVSVEVFCLLWPMAARRRRSAHGNTLLEVPLQPALFTLRWLEIAVLPTSGLVFLAAIHRFAPLYFTSALPILHLTYWAIGHLSLLALLWEAVELLALAAVTGLLLLRSPPRSPTAITLAIAGLGALAAYLAQGTGWYYQQLPALTFFAVALAVHLLDIQARHPVQPPARFPHAVGLVCLLAVVLTAHFMGYPFTEERAFDLQSPDPAFFTHLAPGTPVAILTTSVDEAMMPVERFHLTWAQRTNNLWLLPAILRSEALSTADPRRRLPPLQLARLRETQQRWMVEDLTRWSPELILVERCQNPAIHCQVLEDRHYDLLAWFERDPHFWRIWQKYHYTRTLGRFDAYTLGTPPSQR